MNEIIFIAVAFVLGYVFQRIGLPPLLGYLVGGFALSSFQYTSTPAIENLSHLGVILLLFTLGLKIRLKNFLQPEVVVSGVVQIMTSAGILSLLIMALGMLQGGGTGEIVLLGILFGVASTVVAAKGLEEKGEIDAYHGRLAIGILVMEDIILIGILAFTGLRAPSTWSLALMLLPLTKPLFIRVLRSIKDAELLLLYGILMAFTGAWLFEFLHLSAELGAFCLGLLHAGEKKSEELSEKLWALREAFLIGFFLKIGLTGTPGWKDLMYAMVLVMFLPFRVGIFFMLLTRFRLRARTAFLTSASLASFSEFALITGAVAISAGLLPSSLLTTLATTVALSFLVGTLINRHANQLYSRFRTTLKPFESRKQRSDAEPDSIGITNFIVVGMGETGKAAYNYLAAKGQRVLGLDTDPGVLETLRARNLRVLFGDANSNTLWQNMELGNLQGIVLALPEVEAKLNIIDTLRKRGFIGAISTLVETEEEASRMKAAGVNTVFYPEVQAGTELAERVVMSRLK